MLWYRKEVIRLSALCLCPARFLLSHLHDPPQQQHPCGISETGSMRATSHYQYTRQERRLTNNDGSDNDPSCGDHP
jgi:hypothetical protein